ncbi:DNA translocase FtsK [Bosea sp. (in: a-proteobacteria)]|uniref:DNA translocase FtsK n=1 Tax=Bosea sp. (in: a-proteobacteria) TaxID=1871050 RepID=UPI003FA548C2
MPEVIEASVAESCGDEAPLPAAEVDRVRYWRTPRHLMQQVWGEVPAAETGLPEALPGAIVADPGDEVLAIAIAESDCREPDAAETCLEAMPTTPFAFLSDDAFWEFIPAAERSDEAVAESLPVEAEPALLPPPARPRALPKEKRPLAPAASLVTAPAVAASWIGMGWTQGYKLDLSFAASAPVARMPAPELPVQDSPAPAPKAGISVARAARPERVPEPAPQRPKRRSVEIAPPVPVVIPGFQLPPIEFLAEPPQIENAIPVEILQQNAGTLEGVLEDFNVRGEVVQACPGPVVTLYELEPAPGTKSSRVISLADDIARSMSAISARVAVVQGKNAIGIELPNARRETVFLRELLASQDFESTKHKLALCLGKTIGGEPVIADLARMPHLLVAGTTGSGKSVAINTMILSILYRLKPEQCRLIMVDPKMLELSVYDGIPHLLTPVVTDPKKAVVALKWAVREMEERYKKMSKLGVRNIDGFNVRVGEAKAAGEVITRTVQTGFDRHSGEAIYEEEAMDLEPLPYIVVIVDEMADLMMVAGKEIEGTIQRLAQMARAAGIHVVLATQRPSVDVITGTIKANFPTRISFQVTSKIDSRTILGEMGAEQLLGQGDMLYMAGGGRITRVHGPFVSDAEVEKVVAHLKTQGRPDYLDSVLAEEEAGAGDDEDGAVFDKSAMGQAESEDPYDQAVAVVLRDKKASTSYIQRRLQIGYNRAASIMERMEHEGIVGPANHAGKREILVETGRAREDED